MKPWYRSYLFSVGINIVFLAIVGTVTWFVLEDIEQKTKLGIRESLQTVLNTTQEAQQIWVSHKEEDVLSLAGEPAVISIAQDLLKLHEEGQGLRDHAKLIALRKLLQPHLEKHDDTGFFIIAEDRHNIASMRNTNIGSINLIHLQKPALLNKAFKGGTLLIPTIRSDVPLDKDDNPLYDRIPTMFMVTPIYNDQREVIAIFALRMNPFQNFTRITQLGRVGETGETYAFDENAYLITESRFDHHLRRIGLINPGEKGILTIRIKDPGGNLLEGFSSLKSPKENPPTLMAANAIAGNNSYNIDGYRDYRGVPVFGAWLWNKHLNYGLTTEIDVAEALQPYYHARAALLGVVCTTIILGFFMQYVFFRMQRESKRSLEKVNIEMEFNVKERTRELLIAKDRLSSANKELSILAVTDSLTGLSNRRHFDNQYRREWEHCIRDHKAIAILMLDIDYFKAYNDTYGHQVGDECLLKISTMLQRSDIAKRPGDLVARYGGEEFIVVLSDTNEKYTKKIAEDIRTSVLHLNISHQSTAVENQDTVSISVGSAISVDLTKSDSKTLITQADDALYQAKARGRNQTCHYTKQLMSNLVRIDKR